MSSSGGSGAARPPPSASMGKLSLEDEAARKSNANGPSGKNLNHGIPNQRKSCLFTEQALCKLCIL